MVMCPKIGIDGTRDYSYWLTAFYEWDDYVDGIQDSAHYSDESLHTVDQGFGSVAFNRHITEILLVLVALFKLLYSHRGRSQARIHFIEYL